MDHSVKPETRIQLEQMSADDKAQLDAEYDEMKKICFEWRVEEILRPRKEAEQRYAEWRRWAKSGQHLRKFAEFWNGKESLSEGVS